MPEEETTPTTPPKDDVTLGPGAVNAPPEKPAVSLDTVVPLGEGKTTTIADLINSSRRAEELSQKYDRAKPVLDAVGKLYSREPADEQEGRAAARTIFAEMGWEKDAIDKELALLFPEQAKTQQPEKPAVDPKLQAQIQELASARVSDIVDRAFGGDKGIEEAIAVVEKRSGKEAAESLRPELLSRVRELTNRTLAELARRTGAESIPANQIELAARKSAEKVAEQTRKLTGTLSDLGRATPGAVAESSPFEGAYNKDKPVGLPKPSVFNQPNPNFYQEMESFVDDQLLRMAHEAETAATGTVA